MMFEQTLERALKLRDTKGDLRGAQRLIDRLVSSYRELSTAQQIILHKESANLLRYRGDLDQALTHYKKGLKLAKQQGDSAQSPNKKATLETGAVIQVPLFVKVGDSIRVNTETGEYVERV